MSHIQYVAFRIQIKSVTGYCYEVISYNASQTLPSFSDLLCIPNWFLIILKSYTLKVSGKFHQRHIIAKYICHTPLESLTCSKTLRQTADSATSHSKEAMLRILSPLKIYRPRPCLNKRNLFPMASTKTTRPPRTAIWSFNNATYCKVHGVKWW